jgi:TRAP-type C4-dicarboxylate transport system permease small subunit
MNSLKGLAIILIAAGAAALAYGGFSYTKDTHQGNIGSLHFSFSDREHLNVPAWAGVAAIVVGAGLLLAPGKKL